MKDVFLLDTNLPSELMRPRPGAPSQGLDNRSGCQHNVSECSVYRRIGRGACNDAGWGRRMRLEASIERFLSNLPQQNILPFTRVAATQWGRLDGMRQIAGRPLSTPDGMIAATALELGLTVVTRNVKDFHVLAGCEKTHVLEGYGL